MLVRSWTWLHHISIWGSIAFFYFAIFVLNVLPKLSTSGADYTGIVDALLGSQVYWLSLLVTVPSALFIDYCVDMWQHLSLASSITYMQHKYSVIKSATDRFIAQAAHKAESSDAYRSSGSANPRDLELIDPAVRRVLHSTALSSDAFQIETSAASISAAAPSSHSLSLQSRSMLVSKRDAYNSMSMSSKKHSKNLSIAGDEFSLPRMMANSDLELTAFDLDRNPADKRRAMSTASASQSVRRSVVEHVKNVFTRGNDEDHSQISASPTPQRREIFNRSASLPLAAAPDPQPFDFNLSAAAAPREMKSSDSPAKPAHADAVPVSSSSAVSPDQVDVALLPSETPSSPHAPVVNEPPNANDF